jgi:hypothetical protein
VATWKRLGLWIGLPFVGLAAGAVLLLLRDDWNWARRPIAWGAQLVTGRSLDLAGDLRVELGRVTRVEARRLRFGNAEWGAAEDLLRAERLAVGVRVAPLLAGRVRLDSLELDSAAIALERDAEGLDNWTLRLPAGASAAADFHLPRALRVRDTDLTLTDPARPNGFALHVEALDTASSGEETRLAGRGRYQNEPFQIDATLPAMLRGDQTSIPITATATVGRTAASADGTIGRSGGADVALRLSAPSLDALWTLVGFPLPRSPAFTVDGRLVWAGREVALRSFAATIGKSDLAGDLRVSVPADARMRIAADLRSRAVDLDDVEGFYGRTPREESSHESDAPPNPRASVFPNVPFDFAKLRVADATIRYRADEVRGRGALDDVALDATLEKGRLRLHPLELGMSAGDLAARGTVDASGPTAVLDAELVIRNVDLATLLARMEIDEPAAGTFGGRFEVKSRGGSLGELAAHLDGELGVVLRRGRLGDSALELVALHLGDYLVSRLDDKDDTARPIDCLVGVFDARDGTMTARTLLLDTRHVRIEGEGSIDLAKEQMDLVLRQHSKDFSLGALRTPIEIEGPLATRRARLQAGPLLTRGGAAAALAMLHPAAALLALVDPGSDDKPDACARALAEYRPIAADVAPPPRAAG